MYKDLIKKTLIFGISTIGIKLISFALLPLYTYYLSTSQYGTIELLMSTVSILLPLLTLGLSLGILKFVIEQPQYKSQIFTSFILVWVASLVIVIFLSPLLFRISAIRDYKVYFYIIYGLVSLETLSAQYVKGANYIKIFALSGIIKTLVFSLLNIVLLSIFGMKTEGYFISYIASFSISILFFMLVLIKKEKLKFDFNLSLNKKLILISLPFVPNSISWWVNNASDRYVLLFLLGTSATGLYSVAYKVPVILMSFTTVFNSAWQLVSLKNNDDIKNEYAKLFRRYSEILSLITISLMLLSPLIAKYLFLGEFYDAWKFVSFLLAAMFFGAIASFYDAILITKKSVKNIYLPTLFGAIINVLLNLVLVPKIGIIGAAVATMVSYLVIMISKMVIFHDLLSDVSKKLSFYVLIIIFLVTPYLMISSIQTKKMFLALGLLCVIIISLRTIHSVLEALLTHFRKETRM